MNVKQISLPLAFLFLIFSCENSSESDLIDPVDNIETVTYTTHIAPIINNNCIVCHANPAVGVASMPMTNYDEVKFVFENTDAFERINRQPGESGFMPYNGVRLPQSSIDLIDQWINQSYQE